MDNVIYRNDRSVCSMNIIYKYNNRLSRLDVIKLRLVVGFLKVDLDFRRCSSEHFDRKELY